MFSFGGKAIMRRRHVHVYGKNGKLISRVKLDTMEPMDAARIDRRIVAIIRDLQKEGRL